MLHLHRKSARTVPHHAIARSRFWEGVTEMTTAEVGVLDPGQLTAASEALAAVYGAAFAQPPYNEPEEAAGYFAQILRRNAANPPAGFRCCIARAAPSGAFVGFGYGFTYGPGTSRFALVVSPACPVGATPPRLLRLSRTLLILSLLTDSVLSSCCFICFMICYCAFSNQP